MRHPVRSVPLLLLLILSAFPGSTLAQDDPTEFVAPDWILDLKLPNAAGKSLLTPTGWGAAYNTVFAGVGYQKEVPFRGGADGDWGFGFGVGDPVKLVGIQVMGAVQDLSGFKRITLGGKVHRYLGHGTSIAAGAENLIETLDDDAPGGNPGRGFFAVISHTVQGIPGAIPGTGRFHVSLGAGSGRFAHMSYFARRNLDKTDGTWLFANVAAELSYNWNLIGEWDGTGLNAGMSYAFAFANPDTVFSVAAGIADITKNASDQPRFVAGGGVAMKVF